MTCSVLRRAAIADVKMVVLLVLAPLVTSCLIPSCPSFKTLSSHLLFSIGSEGIPTSLLISSWRREVRHIGHVVFLASHSSMHSTWNECLHTGRSCSFSWSWYSSRHTGHLRAQKQHIGLVSWVMNWNWHSQEKKIRGKKKNSLTDCLCMMLQTSHQKVWWAVSAGTICGDLVHKEAEKKNQNECEHFSFSIRKINKEYYNVQRTEVMVGKP